VGDYLLGQCCRCRTMFWAEAVPIPVSAKDGVVELTDSLET
jgi:hypothetical protein